jgi:hypothetical protein
VRSPSSMNTMSACEVRTDIGISLLVIHTEDRAWRCGRHR